MNRRRGWFELVFFVAVCVLLIAARLSGDALEKERASGVFFRVSQVDPYVTVECLDQPDLELCSTTLLVSFKIQNVTSEPRIPECEFIELHEYSNGRLEGLPPLQPNETAHVTGSVRVPTGVLIPTGEGDPGEEDPIRVLCLHSPEWLWITAGS